MAGSQFSPYIYAACSILGVSDILVTVCIDIGSLSRYIMGRRASVDGRDDAQLAALGVKQELRRNFSPLSMLGLAFAILNSWTALSLSLSLALPSGGSTAVLWGLVTAGVFNLSLAASLAEFLSAYPTAGGQYHWVALISWKKQMPLLSW